MRKTFAPAAMVIAFFLTWPSVTAGAEEEISADLMQTIEGTTKSLDSNVALKNAKAAQGEAKEIVALLKQVEAHFERKPNAADAVGFARKSKGFAADVAAAVAANDFSAASAAVRSLVKSCKTCHEIYKKD